MTAISENLILIAGNIVQPEDPLTKLDALSLVNDFFKDVQNMSWFLENLHTVEHEYTRGIILGNVADHIHTSWANIDPALYEQLIQEFFTEIFSDEHYMQKQFLCKIYQIQADLVYQFYPETIPHLFQEIVLVPKPHFYGFLSSLALSLHANSSIIYRDIDGLKQRMLEDGSQMLLLSTVLNDVEQGVADAVQAVSSLVEWVDISILNSLEIVQKLFSLIHIPACVEDGILCLLNFLKRPNSPESLAEFITQTDIAVTLEQILNENVTQKTALNIATLIVIMVCPLVETEIADMFFNSAKFLLGYDDMNVSSQIIKFWKPYVKSHPDKAEDIANITLEKILAVIESEKPDKDIALQDPLSLLKSTAMVAKSLTEQMLTLSTQLDPSENMSGCAALLAALVKSISDNEPQLEMETIKLFRGLLEVEVSGMESSYFIAIACYSKMAGPYIDDPQNKEFAIELFRVGANVAITYNDDICTLYHNYLQDTLIKITNSYPADIFEIDGIDDIICSFISSGQEKLLKMAITLSHELPTDDRMELYTSCLTAFNEELSSAEILTSKAVRPIFEFITGMNIQDCDSIKPGIREFLVSTKTIPEQNRNFLPLYVKAAVKTLGVDSFDLFWDSVNALEWDIIGEIAEAAIGIENPEELLKIGEMLLSRLHLVPIQNIGMYPVSDQELSFTDFHIKCALYFMRSGVYPLMNEEGQLAIINELSDIISQINISYDLTSEILDFEDSVMNERIMAATMVNSKIMGYICSKKEKDYKERSQAEALLYKYFRFSRHQIAISKEIYTGLIDRAYRGSLIPPSLRMEYSEIALLEDDDEFEAKVHEFIQHLLQRYTLGAPPNAIAVDA